MTTDIDQTSIDRTAQIVIAYVSANPVSATALPDLIRSVHSTLANIGAPAPEEVAPQEPAVPVRKSITGDFLICLENGKKFKSLKRHLRTHHNLTPEQYRAKWNLPADYPMVAPNYSATRSQLAKDNGLGRKPGFQAAA